MGHLLHVLYVIGGLGIHVSPWHFEKGISRKIDDVLVEYGGLLHALPLAVHLKFFLTDKLG